MIAPGELAALAEVYDRYARALDPLSAESEEAGRQFWVRLEGLHRRECPTQPFEEFRYQTVQRCKEYLRKN
jgi:hypothetical protein